MLIFSSAHGVHNIDSRYSCFPWSWLSTSNDKWRSGKHGALDGLDLAGKWVVRRTKVERNATVHFAQTR